MLKKRLDMTVKVRQVRTAWNLVNFCGSNKSVY